ncbi:MAG: BatA domain-containing protein, partial [Planctomycetaceae bacterium]
MFFGHPWLLFGLGLCVIPILIHLLSRRVHRREPWAAMRFLRAALERRSRQLRLESLLLLILRALVVLLLVLALAEPIFFAAGGPEAISPVQRIFLVDLSASLATVADGERRIDHARREVDAILDQAAPGDRFQLVRIATLAPRTLIRQSTAQLDEVRAELARWDVTEERGNVEAALQSVTELLRSPDEGLVTEVVIVSDWQRSNWQPDVTAAAPDSIARLLRRIASAAKLRVIDVSGSPNGNLTVAELYGNRTVAVPGQPFELTGTIRNFGSAPTSARLEWVVQGRVEESALVEVAGLGETRVRHTISPPTSDELDVELRLVTDDALAVDNHRFATWPVRTSLEVLVVDGRPALRPIDGAGGFVSLALKPPQSATGAGSGLLPVHVQQIADTQLASVDLDRFDCVWLCDIAGVEETSQQRLAAYVENGGGVVLTVGDQTNWERWRDWRSKSGQPLLPASLLGARDVMAEHGEPVGLQLTTPPHPSMQPFVGNPRAGLQSTRIRQYINIEPNLTPQAQVVLRFSDGEPAILRQSVDEGQFYLVLTSVDDRWGNWSVWPSFPPVVHALTVDAAMGSSDKRQLMVGQPIEKRLPPSQRTAEATLTTPRSTSFSLTPECSTDVCRLRFDGSGVAVFYRLSVGNCVESVAVYVIEAESQPATLDEAALGQG